MNKNTETKENSQHSTVRDIPLLPSIDLVLFPHMVVPWVVEQPNLVKLIDDALATDRTIAVVAATQGEKQELALQKTGTLALILRMAKNEQGHAKLIVQGVTRIKLLELTRREPYLKARVEPMEDVVSDDLEIQALVVNVRHLFSKVLELSPNLPNELGGVVASLDDPGVLADIVVSHLNVALEDKQAVLDAQEVKNRLEKALQIQTRWTEPRRNSICGSSSRPSRRNSAKERNDRARLRSSGKGYRAKACRKTPWRRPNGSLIA
jgi:ATP-dependent Lon protease